MRAWRWRKRPPERVGGKENKDKKSRGNEASDTQGQELQLRIFRFEPGDKKPEDTEHKDPEQHRALMIAPGAGDFIEERFGRMGILNDIEHREI